MAVSIYLQITDQTGVWKRPLSELVTSVRSQSNEVSLKFELNQNYPNPFNPTTKISYSIPLLEFVSLKVYDLLGKEVATLVNDQKHAGKYEVTFNATDLSSGVYFY